MILPTLEPPAGGLVRLLARREARMRWLPEWPALAAGAATAILFLAVRLGNGDFKMPFNGARLAGERDSGIALQMLDGSRATPVPSDDPNVKLYLLK